MNNCCGCVHENAIGGPCRGCVDSSNRLDWDEGRIPAGTPVLVQGDRAICMGDNPKVPGNYWIQFIGQSGSWSFYPSDVQPITTTKEIE